MYIPPAFRLDDTEAALKVMRENPFAVLVAHRADTVEISHLPLMVVARESGLVVRGHVARANAMVAMIEDGAAATAVFGGAHAYISPDWYASENQVPTWNYVAVHAAGRLEALHDPAAVAALLTDLSVENEVPLAPKAPWLPAKMTDGLLERMMKGILAFELPVERLEAKAKLSQNKKSEDIAGAVDGLRSRGGAGDLATADLMAAFIRPAP